MIYYNGSKDPVSRNPSETQHKLKLEDKFSTIYYIFRHGETYESLNKIDYSPATVFSAELLQTAKEKTKRIAHYLKDKPTDFNTTSPYPRCVKTSEIVTEITGKKFVPDERIAEFVFQKGETFKQMATRVNDFVADLQQKNYQAVAICTHGGVIAGLKHFLTEGKYELSDLHDYPHPGVLLTIKDKKVEYLDFNGEAENPALNI